MENKSNYKKPFDRLAQIAARIALRSAIDKKSANESETFLGSNDSLATKKRQNALNLAQNDDVCIINHRHFDGGEL